MGQILNSDWSRQNLLRSDWSGLIGAPYTTIDEGHQLELSFWYKCRSDGVEYAQNFDLSLGRLGKPATFHFSE